MGSRLVQRLAGLVQVETLRGVPQGKLVCFRARQPAEVLLDLNGFGELAGFRVRRSQSRKQGAVWPGGEGAGAFCQYDCLEPVANARVGVGCQEPGQLIEDLRRVGVHLERLLKFSDRGFGLVLAE